MKKLSAVLLTVLAIILIAQSIGCEEKDSTKLYTTNEDYCPIYWISLHPQQNNFPPENLVQRIYSKHVSDWWKASDQKKGLQIEILETHYSNGSLIVIYKYHTLCDKQYY